MGTGILGSSTALVISKALGEIVGNTGVEAIILAKQDVDEPDIHESYL